MMGAVTLTDFLLARIAEDEAEGVRAERDWPTNDYNGVGEPTRWLAECEAKRRIVEAHRTQVGDDDPHAWIVASNVLLKALAAPYADHPDYREEWKP